MAAGTAIGALRSCGRVLSASGSRKARTAQAFEPIDTDSDTDSDPEVKIRDWVHVRERERLFFDTLRSPSRYS